MPTQPSTQWVMQGLSMGIKWQGMKMTTYLLLVLRLMHACNYNPFPPYVFMQWWLIKHRDNLLCCSSYHVCLQIKVSKILPSYNGNDRLLNIVFIWHFHFYRFFCKQLSYHTAFCEHLLPGWTCRWMGSNRCTPVTCNITSLSDDMTSNSFVIKLTKGEKLCYFWLQYFAKL